MKVLVTSLKEPREEFALRGIDEKFVTGLRKEFQTNKAIFVKPLMVIVGGVKSVSEYDSELLESYKLEVIGGNHRRAALQELYQETKDDQFKWANVLLFCGKLKIVFGLGKGIFDQNHIADVFAFARCFRCTLTKKFISSGY